MRLCHPPVPTHSSRFGPIFREPLLCIIVSTICALWGACCSSSRHWIAQFEQVAATLEPRLENNLSEFRDLTKHIAQLEEHTKGLAGAESQLGPLLTRQQQLRGKLSSTTAAISKGEEIVKGFHPFKNKDEWRKKVEDGKQAKAAIEGQLAPLEAQIAQLQATLNGLRAESADLEASRRSYARLLSAMFDGSTPGFPEEQALEDEASAAYARWVEVATDLPALQQANGLLRQGSQLLGESLQRLQGALGANMGAGLMAIGMQRGTMMEIVQQQHIRASGELAQQANVAIMQAKAVMPSIPQIEQIQISQQQGMFLFQLMAGGMFMDLVARQRIKESFDYLVGQKRILDGVCAWWVDKET